MYIEYDTPQSRSVTPIVYRYEVLGIDAARENLAAFTATPHEGKGAAIGNTGRGAPVETIDALQHYRLIYEQADDSAHTSPDDTQPVKTFEYVKGARLKGEGRIEVTIQTNIGPDLCLSPGERKRSLYPPVSNKKFSLSCKNDGPLPAGLIGKDHRGL